MQVFHCKTIPNCRTGYEVMFRHRAMEIVHWISTQIEGYPNFEDHDLITAYGQDEEDRLQELTTQILPGELLPQIDLPSLRCVDETVLPPRSIVRAHLDVYDAVSDDHCPPHRLTRPSYDLQGEDYHQSVYMNLQDNNYKKAVDVDGGVDVETLFRNRREKGWKGTDSLYHAWLLVNHGRTHPLFGIKTFAARHPDFRTVMMKAMDLSPTLTQTGMFSYVSFRVVIINGIKR